MSASAKISSKNKDVSIRILDDYEPTRQYNNLTHKGKSFQTSSHTSKTESSVLSSIEDDARVIEIKPILNVDTNREPSRLDLSYTRSKRDTIPPTAHANVDKGELRR